VVFQGVEWVILLSKGLTMTSSSLGSFFYLLIGFHGLHAILALVILSHFYSKLKRDELNLSEFKAVGFFWAFVVGLWPIIYFKVYP